MLGSVMRARALGAVLAVATLGGCRTSNDLTLPAEDRLLEEVMEAYISERFRFYPVESTLAGLPGNDDRFGDHSRSAIERRVRWLVDFHHKLMGLRLKSLSRRGYLDAQWLTSLVKAELLELEERARWRRTAAFYVDPVRLGLVALLADDDLASRGDALAGRLRDIPRVLANARENLAPAANVWHAHGLESLEACRALLEDLPDMVEGHLPSGRVAELAGLSRAATRAVQDFIEIVPEPGPSAADTLGFALGAEVLKRYLVSNHMLDWPLDEIVRKAEERLSLLTHALTELALRRFPSRSLAALVGPTPVEGSLESAAAAAERRVRAFVRHHGSRAVPASVPVRLVPAYFPGTELARLWRPKALEPSRGAFLMVRNIGRPDVDELELATLREVGGRSRLYVRQAGSASLLRRVLSARTTTEAWLSRFQGRVLDAGYRDDRPELRVEHYHRAIVNVVRLLAVIEIHARGKSPAAAAELFREHGLLSLADARAEAARVAVDPEVVEPALGMLLVEDLATDYFRIHPLKTPADLDERILAHGLLPPRLLRFELGLMD